MLQKIRHAELLRLQSMLTVEQWQSFGRLAAPKSEAIFTLLTTLNTNAVDFWVGLDDRSVSTIIINNSINMRCLPPGQQREHTRFPTEPTSRWREGRLGRRTQHGAPTSPPGRTGSPRTMSPSRRSRTASKSGNYSCKTFYVLIWISQTCHFQSIYHIRNDKNIYETRAAPFWYQVFKSDLDPFCLLRVQTLI